DQHCRDMVRRPVAAPRYVVLESGLTYRGARLTYKTHGTLNPARSNVIVYPASDGAQHPDLEWPIAPGKPVETKYFIIIVNTFGNGLSSLPSNTVRPRPLPAFHDDRQCPGAAAAAGGGVRQRARRAGLRLLDGGAAGVPLGGTVPG